MLFALLLSLPVTALAAGALGAPKPVENWQLYLILYWIRITPFCPVAALDQSKAVGSSLAIFSYYFGRFLV